MATPAVTRLSARDWTDAALEAMAEQGTAGVNVEQLARRLGATKGSFYHHFREPRRSSWRPPSSSFAEEVVEADDLDRSGSTSRIPRERLIDLDRWPVHRHRASTASSTWR